MPSAGTLAVDEAGFEWPLAFMRRELFKKGEYLFKAGEPAEKLFFIASGSVRLPELNRFMKAGQVIGEVGVFSPERCRSASAVAEGEVETFTMGREEVSRLMSRDSLLATNLIEVILKRILGQLKLEIEARERLNAELRIAHNIQTGMLPRLGPPLTNRKEFQLHALMEPAREVGGDFYDFFLVEAHKLCALVGDVSGKGVPAALLMALSKTLLRSEALQGFPPHEMVERVNKALCVENRECMFLTVFCLLLNTQTGEVEYCSAGHNPPLLRTRDGGVSFLPLEPGLLVGYEENFRWESRTLKLKAGDTLFLYTDGVTEAENHQQKPFSEEGLQLSVSTQSVSDLGQTLEGVRAAIARHAQGQAPSDDITLLALRFNGR